MVEKYFSKITGEFKTLKKGVFTKGSFAQNFVFNFSGRSVALLVQAVFAPLLARIYSPDAFGVFSFFTATTVNLALLSTLSLDGAFVLPKTDSEFKKLLKAVLWIATIFSIIVFLVTSVFGDRLGIGDTGKQVGWLKYLIGPGVFLASMYKITQRWGVRNNAFKEAFQFEAPIGMVAKILNLGYGVLTKGSLEGLILADVLAKIATVWVRFRYVLRTNMDFLKTRLTYREFKDEVSKYRQFPLFDLPGNWINLVSSQLPIFLLAYSFGTNPVGQLGFASNLLDIPLGLLGSAVAPVFLKKAADTYTNNPSDLSRITSELYRKLFYMGIIPFALITVFGDVLFQWVFGPRWLTAGVFTGCLGIYYLFRLISSPLVSIFVITKKQHQLFMFQIALFAGRLIALCVGLFLIKDVIAAIFLFGLFSTIAYFVLSIWVLKIVKAPVVKLTVRSVLITIVVVAIFLLIKKLLLGWIMPV